MKEATRIMLSVEGRVMEQSQQISLIRTELDNLQKRHSDLVDRVGREIPKDWHDPAGAFREMAQIPGVAEHAKRRAKEIEQERKGE